MKFCKRLLLATTAVSLTLLLSVAGSVQAQQRCQTDGQERKVHLHLSDPQLPEELVCEVIDEFTDRYSEQLAQWTHQGQSVQHQHGRHHSNLTSPTAAPAGTIGNTFSSGSTRTSSRKAPGCSFMAWMAVSSSSRFSTHR